MKYSPSYLVFTSDRKNIVLTITGEDLSEFDLSKAKIVTVTTKGEVLDSIDCTTVPVQTFATSRNTKESAVIEFTMTQLVSERLAGCITSKNQYVALQIDIPSKMVAGKITTQQRALLPIFDNTRGNILTSERTASVLGELSRNLRIQSISCNKDILYKREDVVCSTEVTNATESAVFTNVISTVREGLPPGVTLRENIERTNILLLPGQSYSISFTIPKEIYATLNNKIAITTSFSSIGTEGTDYSVNSQHTIWFLPPAIILLFSGVLLLISAILFRKKLIKFITGRHGTQKANT